MAFIIYLDDLYDSLNERLFGLVGLDLDTGKLHFYSHYDKDGLYDSRYLYEFDIKNMPNKRLKWQVGISGYKRNKFSELLPQKVKPIFNDIVYTHAVYNQINGYPIDNLSNNVKRVLLDYTDRYSKSLERKYRAEYIPLENVINLTIDSNSWEKYPEESQKEITESLIHEVGHMKVSSYKLDKENNIIKITTGLSSINVTLTPHPIVNGDILYMLNFTEVDLNFKALEEIINDYDCSICFPYYKISYPNLGGMLNYLCDNLLLLDRYENKDILESSLMNIINSADLYQELLEHIGESVFGSNRRSSEENAQQLIKRYVDVKIKKQR